ncbi:SDR family NAD(P)-dependent oxidoreductase [Cognaticolwellia mytili]|uniref:SDR family NAD(P)-dependent oxidoreductase n=1 Tax=Cognaticolwellia mytili TaxID=1888913 RepID=UPI001F38F8E6|nr:SDR family NAD(P)-dependent oxidoreductase [Cognaticolwellia mytili]
MMTFKNVLITGGSSGIGLDLAKAYAKQGANVMLLARNQSRLEDAATACTALCSRADQKVIAFSVDVGNSEAFNHLVNDIKAQIGTLDLIILSAGIVQSVKFMEQSEQDFNDIMYTNVAGSRIVAKAFLPDMITQGKGQVCFVGSLGGLIATYGYSAYSASKFAVVGMAGALRQELYSSGVGVSVLCPPEVDTPMVAKEASHILPETRFVKDIGGLLNTTTVTKAAIKGINKNQFIIVPGFKGKMSYILARYMPNIFAWAIQKLVGLAGKFIK